MTTWWTQPIQEVCQTLKTNPKEGLKESEALERAKKFGPNILPSPKSISPLLILLRQFSSFIIWVLIIAAIVTGFIGDWVDTIAITAIIILNATLGFIQEFRAEKSLMALRELSTPTAKVIRNGTLRTIPAISLIPGDLVLVEAGDHIPADGRLINSVHLATQEAALTGESIPISKKTEPIDNEHISYGDRLNMLYMGTVVVGGRGHYIVTEIGLKTELGKIAKLLESSDQEQTPLQIRLEKLGHLLVSICIVVVGIIFFLGLVRGNEWMGMIMTSLSLAVASIPCGLPAVVTVSLAFGVRKMINRNALIRRLSSVETLGSTTIICTDKTGTLTQNKMVVRAIWVNEEEIIISGSGYNPEGDFFSHDAKIIPSSIPELMEALKIGILCNNANLLKNNEDWSITGDPTEGCLIVAAMKGGLNKALLEEDIPLVNEIPFDSERKRMTMFRLLNGQKIGYTKGAPDIIIERCSHILIHGQLHPLSSDRKEKILNANQSLANRALRVLAVAYQKCNNDEMERNLIFVGLIAMMDPPRPEVKEAIKICKEAGIRTIMITGDHKITGMAIAKELDLIEKGEIAINGSDIDGWSDKKLSKEIKRISVYARATAQHKIRIVKAWRKLGEIVAMTGDGVNDAPAVKKADIGISMGITGTDVTKESSDMVILDDNFASIVNAVEEGRCIYDNIMKFVRYLITSNFAEILVIFIGMLFNLKDSDGSSFIILLPAQLLWINLVTDGLPAVALGVDPVNPEAMHRPPRDPKSSILTRKDLFQYLSISCVMALATLIAGLYGARISISYAQTMAFTLLVVLELAKVQIIRSQYNMKMLSNSWLLLALLTSFAMQIMVLYIPFLQPFFGTVALTLQDWGILFGLTTVVWIVAKAILQATNSDRKF